MHKQLTEHDLYLFNEGTHTRIFKKLGAHPCVHGGKPGVHFAVWAPSAHRVSVIGDFNGWNRDAAPLAPAGSSGIWTGFIAGASAGDRYKYFIEGPDGFAAEKADPVGAFHEIAPKTASIVFSSTYVWGDDEWMKSRAEKNALDAPVSIYELHLGSWRRHVEDGDRALFYREIAEPLARYVRELGFSHIELMPIMEHPFYGSWGYQVTGFFAPTSRYGTPDDFRYFVDVMHKHGIGVVVDFPPAHFPDDPHGLGYFDGTHQYEHADPRQGRHPDWGSLIFNYGRHEVRSFLLSSAIVWLEEFHIDGLRVDGVASMLYLDYSRAQGEWIPNRYGGRENIEAVTFLRQMNETIYAEFPDVQTIAEESTAWPMVSRPTSMGGLGFGMKWDMGWMHDTLEYMAREPVHRRYHHNELTFRAIYQHNENFVLALSHDEVVHGKGSLLRRMPGDDWQKFANLRLLLASMWTLPGKKLLFMGCEFGQNDEWNHDRSLDWHLLAYHPHSGLSRLVRRLNHLYTRLGALHELDFEPSGFEWLVADDADQSVLVFMRHSRGDLARVVVACNYTPVPRHGYRIGVPHDDTYFTVLSTDDTEFGGSDMPARESIRADHTPSHGRSHSIALDIPPLGAVVLSTKKVS